MLGTSFSLWLVGIRSTHEHGLFQKWTQWIVLTLILATMELAAVGSLPGETWYLTTEIKNNLPADYRVVKTYVDHRSGSLYFRIIVEGPTTLSGQQVAEIDSIARRNGLNEDVFVEVETRIVAAIDPSMVNSAESGGEITPVGGGLRLRPARRPADE